ncbi:MAG: TraB/GumN family protein [Luteolibacter sp.]|uniref:TraB/GumN family protein n=1 Tax=Luteolibacter sp. TaxID=1962973 RepID=UPI003265313A
MKFTTKDVHFLLDPQPLFPAIGNLWRKLGIAALGCLPVVANVHAEPDHPVKPLLWQIEGPGIKSPSYLFGTIHFGQEPISTLHPSAAKAFEKATHLHTEVPLDTASQTAAIPLFNRDDGKTLADSLGEDLSEQLDAELKLINPKLDAQFYQPLKTWYIGFMLPSLPFLLDGTKPLDFQLWERASKAGKKTSGMQSFEQQITGFRNLTEEEQVFLLADALDGLKKQRAEGINLMRDMIDAYTSGDTGKVEAVMNRALDSTMLGEHKKVGERLMQSILYDRNVIMADYVSATLKNEPDEVQFFAVGAGHFIGKSNVRFYLEQKGYTITRIE